MPVKRRGNKWQARFRWYDDDGKQQSISKTFTLKADADNWLLDRQADHQQGMNKKLTRFIWLFDHYYNTYKKDFLKENTRKTWDNVRKHIVEYFGENKTIQSISSDDFQQFLNSLSSLKHSTVKVTYQCCQMVFKYSVHRGYINRSPADMAIVGGKKNREVTYLNTKQIKQVLNYCRTYRIRRRENKDVWVSTPVVIEAAILSGCRLGELAGLTWDNVDVDNCVFHIVRQLDVHTSKYDPNHPTYKFMDVKTKSSVRDVQVPRSLIDDMLKIRDKDDVLCFYTQRNHPVNSSSTSRYVHRMFRKLKIDAPNFHFHSFRHSHVALLLSHDVDIYAISKRLGHKNIRTTLQVYSYLMEEKEDKENAKIMKTLNGL